MDTVTAPTSTFAPANPGARKRPRLGVVSTYLELAKARLAAMVVLTTVVGFLLGARGWWNPAGLLWVALGTALSAFGANILNQLVEQDRDRRMQRTRSRPLPSGRATSGQAARWGAGSSLAGLAILAAGANLLTAGLSLLTIALYVAVYTPLKPRTPLSTVVGAVVGAVPPMMGWAAATGRLDLGAWILGGILFVWQIPHFLALAWMYRDDYARAGYRLLPAVDRPGDLTARLALLYILSLLPVTAALALVGVSGLSFLAASQVLGLGFAAIGWRFVRRRTEPAARRLFVASILYLPLLLVAMVADMHGRDSSLERAAPPSVTVALVVADPPAGAGGGL
jgi:protoheme IX farnesyltransferase